MFEDITYSTQTCGLSRELSQYKPETLPHTSVRPISGPVDNNVVQDQHGRTN